MDARTRTNPCHGVGIWSLLLAGTMIAACGASEVSPVATPPASSSPSTNAALSTLAPPASPLVASTSTPTAAASASATAAPTRTPEPWETMGLCPDYSGPATEALTVVVMEGDTLARIAGRAGVSVEQILQANPQIQDRSLIRPGDRIVIPADVRNVTIRGDFSVGACWVGGWACDPNDPSTRVTVRVVADGRPLLAQVVDEAPNGVTYGIELGDVISSGIEHRILVQGQDLQTREWIDLAAPKTLVCTR